MDKYKKLIKLNKLYNNLPNKVISQQELLIEVS
jgi:hypothetical protein